MKTGKPRSAVLGSAHPAAREQAIPWSAPAMADDTPVTVKTLREAKTTPRILVVDDDPMVRDIVVETIRAVNYHVDMCGAGDEALRRAAASPYDLIITDMRLPGMNGLDLIRRLKVSKNDADVIVITGFGSIENAVECMKAGAVEYLIKPFTIDQLQVSVQKAVELRDLRRKAKEREFYRELSYVDALTGVRNRRYFDEALHEEVERARRTDSTLVMLLIDVDDFKIYNDVNGHQRGDEALTKIAGIFQSACRGYDIITRYGGEEFAILFPRASTSHALEMANRILSAVRNSAFPGQENQPLGALSVSVGVACYPDDAADAEELVKLADEALYRAKSLGKDRVVRTQASIPLKRGADLS